MTVTCSAPSVEKPLPKPVAIQSCSTSRTSTPAVQLPVPASMPAGAFQRWVPVTSANALSLPLPTRARPPYWR